MNLANLRETLGLNPYNVWNSNFFKRRRWSSFSTIVTTYIYDTGKYRINRIAMAMPVQPYSSAVSSYPSSHYPNIPNPRLPHIGLLRLQWLAVLVCRQISLSLSSCRSRLTKMENVFRNIHHHHNLGVLKKRCGVHRLRWSQYRLWFGDFIFVIADSQPAHLRNLSTIWSLSYTVWR